MLTQTQELIVKEIVDNKVSAKEQFTAFEVTKELRRTETDRVFHGDVRDHVHLLMEDYVQLNEYERNFHRDPNGWNAFMYSPVPVQDVSDSTLQSPIDIGTVDPDIDSNDDAPFDDSYRVDSYNPLENMDENITEEVVEALGDIDKEDARANKALDEDVTDDPSGDRN